jgi:hypothetical protein
MHQRQTINEQLQYSLICFYTLCLVKPDKLQVSFFGNKNANLREDPGGIKPLQDEP